MNAYKVQTQYNSSQPHIVIADNVSEAEKALLKKYPTSEILELELISEYVTIAENGDPK